MKTSSLLYFTCIATSLLGLHTLPVQAQDASNFSNGGAAPAATFSGIAGGTFQPQLSTTTTVNSTVVAPTVDSVIASDVSLLGGSLEGFSVDNPRGTGVTFVPNSSPISISVGNQTVAVPQPTASAVAALITGNDATLTSADGASTTITPTQAVQALNSEITTTLASSGVSGDAATTLASDLTTVIGALTSNPSLENLNAAVEAYNAVVTAGGLTAVNNPAVAAIRVTLEPIVNSVLAALPQ